MSFYVNSIHYYWARAKKTPCKILPVKLRGPVLQALLPLPSGAVLQFQARQGTAVPVVCGSQPG